MSKVGPAYKDKGLDATTLADSKINKWLINGIHLSIKHVLSSSVSYFVVCCFYHKIFNIIKLLNHVAPSVELMTQKNKQSDTNNHGVM